VAPRRIGRRETRGLLGETVMFQTERAIELIDVCNQADLQGRPDVTISPSGGPCTVRGSVLQQANTKAFAFRSGNSDTEGLTTISEAGDIAVAFRGSEVGLIPSDGALRDWLLTDFRSNRMPYPLQPGTWPNHNWVHTGFWIAYNGARDTIAGQVRMLMQLSNIKEDSRIFVTGFSLGGALAMLAALDLSLLGLPLELYMFASPRVGDTSLNKLMRQRVSSSFMVGYRGDPIIHVPPVGPNFPLTLHKEAVIEIGPANIDVLPGGLPLPQIGQEYTTPDEIVYLDGDGSRKDQLPFGLVTVRFADHDPSRYRTALTQLAAREAPKQDGDAESRSKFPVGPILHMMRL
jgi:Lipase (class 3)